MIRLGRLLEGESRVPPPLVTARASIVLLSLERARARMRTGSARDFEFLATAAADAATENVAWVFERRSTSMKGCKKEARV